MAVINFYAHGGLDRAAHLREAANWLEAALARQGTRLVPVWQSRNLIQAAAEIPQAALLPAAEAADLLSEAGAVALLGNLDEVAHLAVDLSHLAEAEAQRRAERWGEWLDLRRVGPVIDRRHGSLLAYARGLMHWHARHGFCGVCGSPTESASAGHVRKCRNPACGASHFPRTDPAVIMLVHDGERALLGRQKIWPKGMYSTLAGFVEPGESLEETVAREVFEESGIRVKDVVYHSSQPWPFPASLMVGFHATAASRAIDLNVSELEDAAWFTRAEMRAFADQGKSLPRLDSIARQLVEDWLARG
ncbi:MAG: NAD(+) diphosphatase [Proteobacteria bacterium]|nr:NAD(+) diphosphatase [Pseudomonadota bacterium]MBI3496430.1 NAD(+) diphosphatase [Pseudomonadota bacterium]